MSHDLLGLMRRALLAALLACAGLGCSRLPPTQNRADAELISLVVEHDVRAPVHLRLGDSLVIRPSLRNAGPRPVRIQHGSILFVLERSWSATAGEGAPPVKRVPLGTAAPLPIPQHVSWGERRHEEYPNPAAAYTRPLTLVTLAAGERYSPAALYQRPEYHVPFVSRGTYRIRICAQLLDYRDQDVRICQREFAVIVE